MENSWFLEIESGEWNPTTLRFTYLSYDAAQRELKAIEPKLIGGELKFKNDPEATRHHVFSEDGEAVIVLSHVRSVRVINYARFRELSSYAREADKEDHCEVTQRAITAALTALAIKKTTGDPDVDP